MRIPNLRILAPILASSVVAICTLSPRSAALGSQDPQFGDRALRLQTVTLRDPGTDNMESHTLLVPAGWETRGGVTWTPEISLAYVHLDATIRGPEGREVRFMPNGSFTFTESTIQQQWPELGQVASGKVWMPPPNNPSDFIVRHVLPRYRPQAGHAEVSSVREVEAVAKAWREAFAPALQAEAQANAMNAQMGVSAASHTEIAAPLIRVRYAEGGREYEEEFSVVLTTMTSGFDSGFGDRMRSCDWAVYDLRSVRAPAGQLDADTPLLRTIISSVRPTERWYAMLAELSRYMQRLQAETHRVTMREIQKRSKMIAQTGEEIRQMNHDSWKKQQDSSDRLSRAWSNTIRGVDDYQLPDGSTRSLDSSYDHVFTNSLGEFVFSNDASFDPNVHSSQSWDRVRAVAPMGGAATSGR